MTAQVWRRTGESTPFSADYTLEPTRARSRKRHAAGTRIRMRAPPHLPPSPGRWLCRLVLQALGPTGWGQGPAHGGVPEASPARAQLQALQAAQRGRQQPVTPPTSPPISHRSLEFESHHTTVTQIQPFSEQDRSPGGLTAAAGDGEPLTEGVAGQVGGGSGHSGWKQYMHARERSTGSSAQLVTVVHETGASKVSKTAGWDSASGFSQRGKL